MSEKQQAKRRANGTGKKPKSRRQRDSDSLQTQPQKVEEATTTASFSWGTERESSKSAPPPLFLPPPPEPKRAPEEEELDREVDRFLSARQQYMDSVRQLAQHSSRAGLAIDPLHSVGPELDPQLYWRSPWQYDPKPLYSPHNLSLPATTRSLFSPRSFPSYAASAPVWAGSPYLSSYLTSPLYDVQPVSQPLLEQQQQLYYVPCASTLYSAPRSSSVVLPPLKTQPSYYYLYYIPSSSGTATSAQSKYLVPSVPYNLYEAVEPPQTSLSVATPVPFSCLNCSLTRNSIDLASRRLDRLSEHLRHHEDALERDLKHMRRKYGRRVDSGHHFSVNSF